jgi:hypothetical protein
MAEAVRHEPMQTISIIITPCHGRHAVSFDREYLFTNNPYRRSLLFSLADPLHVV